MSEGVVAGRLEVPVESNTAGFGKRLQTAIEKEVAGVVAKVGVEWNEDGLRQRLETAVEKAARGVEAKVEVVADTARAKAEIALLGKTTKVKMQAEGLADDVKRQGLLARLFAKRNPVQYPVVVNRRGFFAEIAARKLEAVAYMKKNPIEIPFSGPSRFRSAIMPLFYLAIASVIQPAIAAVGGAVGAVVAMVGNLGAAIGVLAGAPAVLGGLVSGAMLGVAAFKALDGEIAKTNKTVAAAKKQLDKLKEVWADGQKKAAIAFWTSMDGALGKVGKTILPVVNKGLKNMSSTTGLISKNLIDWAASPLTTGQITRVMGSMDTVLGGMGKTLVGTAKGLLNIADSATLIADGPGGKSLIDRITGAFERAGKWAENIGKPGDAADQLANDLSYAADKASQLWEITKDLASGIKGIFDAGRGTGDSLLKSFEGAISKWSTWVKSSGGQKDIKDWFKAVEPIAKEAGRLLVDIGAAILRLAKDPNVATMLKKIRTDVVPALEKFLAVLGKTLGPEVIDFFTNVLAILSEMAEAGGPLSVGLGKINTALDKFSTWLKANPDMAQKLGVILGGLLAFRALSFAINATGILTLLGGLSSLMKGGGLMQLGGLGLVIAVFAGALKDLPVPLQGAAAALGTFLLLRSSMPAMQMVLTGISDALFAVKYHAVLAGSAFSTSASQFRANGSSGFGAAARAVGTTAKSGLRGAITGLGTAIGLGAAGGGPLGAAIGLVTGLVGVWAAAHANASAKAADYKAHVDAIKASLDAESGALTEATRNTVAKKLMDDGAAEAARKYGVNLSDLTEAALGNADAGARVRKSLADNITKFIESDAAAGQFKATLKAAGVSMDTYSLSQVQGGETAKDMRVKVLDAARAAGIHGIELDALRTKLEKNITGHQDLAAKVGAETAAVKKAQSESKTFNELLGVTKRQVDQVTSSVKNVPGKKTTTIQGLTADAAAKLKALGYTVKTFPDGSSTITATAKTASAVAALNQAARTRYATIYATQYIKTVGGRVGGYNAGQVADGAILSFANGGLRDALEGVRQFGRGAEKHIAQIARPGEWRVWAEPETGGEAYIPLARSKRGRSMEILRQVAERFGMALTPGVGSIAKAMSAQQGSMRQFASFANGAMTGADLTPARSGQVVFEFGAIQVHNPVAEPAGKSISNQLRGLSAFGLFDQEG